MNKLKISTLAFMAVLLLSVNSCKDKTLKFETVSFSAAVCAENPKDTTCRVNVEFDIPVAFHDTLVLKTLQQAIVAAVFDSSFAQTSPKDAPAAFAKSIFADHKKFVDETKNSSNPLLNGNSEFWQIGTEVAFNEQGILSYNITKANYESGAAHETSSTNYYVFDLKTGSRITQNDIFKANSADSIAALLKQQIMSDKDFATEDDLYAELIFADNIRPNNNFMVDSDGITFLFNPYEVASFAYGDVVVTLTFEQLKPYLNEDSAIAKLFKK